MDHSVDRETCDKEREGGVDAVRPSNCEPSCSEVLSGLCVVWRML